MNENENTSSLIHVFNDNFILLNFRAKIVIKNSCVKIDAIIEVKLLNYIYNVSKTKVCMKLMTMKAIKIL